ncbi:hypothetical protein QWY85_04685 [Neolewinella lacunae]|uniref:Uncharacterized protein n=1 Tax=Neolewinella lacunae TaxID=1517758 RepID=A0A923PQU6_9BACT|nr:hypothetical protein [Neolewinella lacunae]MBC6996091.1 hypothetical protein [Neolewinella lacunae]MDN3633944.1 hypothetical protein [Neolewinella lacunae]
MKRTCPECGDEYTGRSDKKFCSSPCRAAHHNRLNAEDTAFQRNVNNILRHNRNVLAELNPEGKANVRRERLIDRGFKFRYFTNEYRTRNDTLYHFCYDYGYRVEDTPDSEWVFLIKRQEYVE